MSTTSSCEQIPLFDYNFGTVLPYFNINIGRVSHVGNFLATERSKDIYKKEVITVNKDNYLEFVL